MQFGKLRHTVEIQSITRTRRDDGSYAKVWGTVDECKVAIKPLSVREVIQAGAQGATLTHSIKMRRYPGLTTKHRFKFGDRVFNIESVLDADERRREHVVICKEVEA